MESNDFFSKDVNLYGIANLYGITDLEKNQDEHFDHLLEILQTDFVEPCISILALT